MRRKFDTVPKIVFYLVALFILLFAFSVCLVGASRKLSTVVYIIFWMADLFSYLAIFRSSYKFSMDFRYLIDNTEMSLEKEDDSLAYTLKNGARWLVLFGVWFAVKYYSKGRYMFGLGICITVFGVL